MPEFVTSVTNGIKQTWSGLNKTQRRVVILGGAVALAVLVAVVIYSTRGPAYEILWSNLDPADAGAIVSELEKQGVPYELTDGGRTIRVPTDRVHRVRLSLATMGLPSSGVVGFEAVGSTGIWSTDFERRVQYVRALSGELTRTITALSGIEDARVHIALPEETVFVSQRQQPTASVLVKTRPGYNLSSESVRGIMNLVSRAVEGLTPENVTVVDASGKLLSKDLPYGEGEDDLSTSSVLELTFATERELENRLLGLLTPVLGPGNVVCQVRAVLNTDKVKITDRTYESEPPGILRSTQETSEMYQGTGAPPGGQAGALDVPSYSFVGQGEFQYQRTEVLRNYEVNERVTETLIVPGTIKQLSVAVVVNKNLNEEEREMIAETVTAALGLDPSRQDQISVTGMVFDTSLAQLFDEEPAPAEGLPRIYIYAIAVAAALVVGTVILIIARRRREAQMAELLEQEPSVALETAPAISPELLARQRSRENVERLARTNPQLVATLIKSWLLEDER
ncbi:MAG: flagellar basal-body MS-ring/collar protein FliF [Bacillota bacterium]|jgi:flagellar M-ring protein FliF|nr:flagellar M-ring protein FliF [Candidatus Fermentithermobacillaceae bacterium]